jgi:hypothetical protein
VSIGIHGVFCAQAFSAASEGGMVSNLFFSFLFFPQVMLMYFLPPAYPIILRGAIVSIDWLRFAGKLVIAFPGSLLYGWICAKILNYFDNRKLN